jgi:hypothetical protein
MNLKFASTKQITKRMTHTFSNLIISFVARECHAVNEIYRREPQNILVIKRLEADKTNNKLHLRARNNPRDTTLVRLLNASIISTQQNTEGQ